MLASQKKIARTWFQCRQWPTTSFNDKCSVPPMMQKSLIGFRVMKFPRDVNRHVGCWKLARNLTSSSSPSFTMTSRINIGRPASTSYHSPDPHGLANSQPSTGYRAANPDHPLERIRAVAKQVEDAIEIYSQPLKPHLPTIGRFLIIVTFYEDALRIMTQWNDQLWYLQTSVTAMA